MSKWVGTSLALKLEVLMRYEVTSWTNISISSETQIIWREGKKSAVIPSNVQFRHFLPQLSSLAPSKYFLLAKCRNSLAYYSDLVFVFKKFNGLCIVTYTPVIFISTQHTLLAKQKNRINFVFIFTRENRSTFFCLRTWWKWAKNAFSQILLSKRKKLLIVLPHSWRPAKSRSLFC